MLRALLADLGRLPDLEVVATLDPRLAGSGRVPGTRPRLRLVPVPPGCHGAVFRSLVAEADAAWIVAPETGGRLASLTALVEARGTPVIGCSSAAVRLAGDKLALHHHLANAGVPVPRTWPARDSARDGEPFPLVLKPVTGAGCAGVRPLRDRREAAKALGRLRPESGNWLLQELVPGVHASASLLCVSGSAFPLSLNGQRIEGRRSWRYRGGWLPLRHDLAGAALQTARRACEAVRGLRGYVGVDLVLTPRGPVVIELNPRLTTAYVGLRAATELNVAAAAWAAAERGILPGTPPRLRPVRFTAAGRVRPAA